MCQTFDTLCLHPLSCVVIRLDLCPHRSHFRQFDKQARILPNWSYIGGVDQELTDQNVPLWKALTGSVGFCSR